MRVVHGALGGRNFDAPPGNKTHPMSEKIRGALFNVLGDIEGLDILDCFAGSGAVAIEGISRGASHAVAVDTEKSSVDTIKKNIISLNIGNRIKAIKANIGSWSDNNRTKMFGIVVCDPPHDKINIKLLHKLSDHTKNDGLVIFCLPKDFLFELESEKFVLLKSTNYGDARLDFYRRLA